MTEKTAVVYILKDKFQFYTPAIGRVIEFRFMPEVVRDLDIINSELLENQIKLFVTNTKISPGTLVFALAENAYFTKDFVQPTQAKGASSQPQISSEVLQKQADEFIEHVPFDNVVSKTIPLKDGMKVVATNKDFYESIAIAFEHLGFTVESVLPGLVIGNGLSLRPALDPPMANLILQKVNTVKQYNLLNQQVYQPLLKQETEEVDEVAVERQLPKKANRKSIYALVGMSPVVVGLFVVLYMQMTAPPPNWKTQASNPTPQPPAQQVPLATVIPTVAPATTTSGAPTSEFATVSVEIVGTANSAATAQSLLSQLDTYKFKSVGLQTQSSVSSGATLVSFAPGVGQTVRNSVLTEVRKVATNVSVQEKQLGTFDITIVLGE